MVFFWTRTRAIEHGRARRFVSQGFVQYRALTVMWYGKKWLLLRYGCNQIHEYIYMLIYSKWIQIQMWIGSPVDERYTPPGLHRPRVMHVRWPWMSSVLFGIICMSGLRAARASVPQCACALFVQIRFQLNISFLKLSLSHRAATPYSPHRVGTVHRALHLCLGLQRFVFCFFFKNGTVSGTLAVHVFIILPNY